MIRNIFIIWLIIMIMIGCCVIGKRLRDERSGRMWRIECGLHYWLRYGCLHWQNRLLISLSSSSSLVWFGFFFCTVSIHEKKTTIFATYYAFKWLNWVAYGIVLHDKKERSRWKGNDKKLRPLSACVRCAVSFIFYFIFYGYCPRCLVAHLHFVHTKS